MEGITRAGLEAAEAAVDSAMGPLNLARMDRADAKLIQEEFANAAAMLKHACALGRRELDAANDNIRGNGVTTDLTNSKSVVTPFSFAGEGKEKQLRDQQEEVVRVHRKCWLARNRVGGLEDSVNRISGV
jgi:hypothetical protein